MAIVNIARRNYRAQRMRQAVKVTIKIAITLALLAIVARSVDLQAMARSVSRIGWMSIVTGYAVLLALSLVQTSRWQAILRVLGSRLTYSRALVIVLMGFFFSQLLPTSIGGDVVRVWKLHREGTPLARAFNSVMLDRVTALLSAVLITIAGASLLFELFPSPAVRYAVTGAVVTAAIGLLTIILALRFPSIGPFFTRLLGVRVSRLLGSAVKDATAVLLNPKALFTTITLSCLTHVAVSYTVWMIAVDAGARVGLVACLVVVPLIILMSMLPISIAGWGIREGAMVIGLGAAGVDSAAALTTSIVFGLILAATGLPGGLFWLYERKHA